MKYIFSEDFVLCSDNIFVEDYDVYMYLRMTEMNYDVDFINCELEFGTNAINVDESRLFGCLDSGVI